MRVVLMVVAGVLPMAAAALPPPLPAGEHPRLSVSRAEIAAVRARMAGDVLVRRQVQRQIAAGVAALDDGPILMPALDDESNTRLIGQAVSLGYAALLADRPDCARRAADILMAYAAVYPTRPAEAEGRVRRYSLQEAIWVCEAATAADLILAANVLAADERQRLCDGLLRPAANTVKTDRRSRSGHKDGHHQCYNFQAWHCAAVGLCGFALEDADLVAWAIDSEYGFRHMLSHDLRDDGIFWERSPGYHSFVISASARLCEAAWRNGIDLWNLGVPDDSREDEWGSGNWLLDGDNGPKSFRMMLEAPPDLMLPDLRAPAISDSGSLGLAGLGAHLELAWLRTGSPAVAQALALLTQRGPPAPAGWYTFSPEGQPAFGGRQEGGRYILTITNGQATDRGAWVSPRVPVGDAPDVRVGLRYRTVGCEAGVPFRVRVDKYRAGKPDSSQSSFLELPTSAVWRETEQAIPVPAGTEEIGIEPFLWKAAGCVELTDVEVRLPDGRVLLDRAEFANPGPVRVGTGQPWNIPEKAAGEALPPADGRFGTTGLRWAGSSLFPASGLAVLRSGWLDPSATAAVLSFGPYGGGHGHPAMLELVLHTGGVTVLPALETASYDSPLHGTWTNTTLAHNTVVVDRQTQWPASKWGHDTAERQVCGELLAFHADEQIHLVRARCRNAYAGTRLERTLLLVGNVLLDVFDVAAEDGATHRFEYVLHGRAPLVLSSLALAPAAPLPSENGYGHLTDVAAGRTAEPLRATFGGQLELTAAPADTEVLTATGLGIAGTRPLPVLILGRSATATRYAVVVQPALQARLTVVTDTSDGVRVRLGPEEWTLALPAAGGAELRGGGATWMIGVPGQPTRRTGAGAERQWPAVSTGGVRLR